MSIVFSEHLEQEGDNRLSARIILELLLVVPVLAEGPDCHLVEASQGEEGGGEALGHHGEADPGPDLVSVVGARHEALQLGQRVGVGIGDLSLLGPSRPEVAEQDMDGEVTKLAEEEEAEADVGLQEAGGGVQRMVDVVGDVSGEAPVVAAVLEEVPKRHRGVTEPVDKDSLEEPLGVVE